MNRTNRCFGKLLSRRDNHRRQSHLVCLDNLAPLGFRGESGHRLVHQFATIANDSRSPLGIVRAK